MPAPISVGAFSVLADPPQVETSRPIIDLDYDGEADVLSPTQCRRGGDSHADQADSFRHCGSNAFNPGIGRSAAPYRCGRLANLHFRFSLTGIPAGLYQRDGP